MLGSELKVTWNVQAGGTKEDTTNHPTVFVGNIGDQIDEYALFEAFSAYNCSDSRIIRGDDGRCLGYGFITIRTQEDAKAAVAAMDGQRLMGRPLRVSFAKTPRLSEADGLQAGGGGCGRSDGHPGIYQVEGSRRHHHRRGGGVPDVVRDKHDCARGQPSGHGDGGDSEGQLPGIWGDRQSPRSGQELWIRAVQGPHFGEMR